MKKKFHSKILFKIHIIPDPIDFMQNLLIFGWKNFSFTTKFLFPSFKITMLKIFSIFTILCIATSCSRKPALEGTKTYTAEYLAEGKIIFENSCGKCHGLPAPLDYSAVDWVGHMNSMAPKAKLNDEQHEMVYNYLVSIKK